jgi:hypothetical protein
MDHQERVSYSALFNAHVDPLRRRPPRRVARRREPQGLAQDYPLYSVADYARRRAEGPVSWRDLYPAYVFALTSHSQDWPRGTDDTDAELAALWEQVRGASRWNWQRVRPVIEDAWQALDHMPNAAIHSARQ